MAQTNIKSTALEHPVSIARDGLPLGFPNAHQIRIIMVVLFACYHFLVNHRLLCVDANVKCHFRK